MTFQIFLASQNVQFLDLKKVFVSAPFIYSLLTILSISSLAIWLYTWITFQKKNQINTKDLDQIKSWIKENQLNLVEDICIKRQTLFSSMLLAGIESRHLGAEIMIETMKSEGKRKAAFLWQRLSLLSDIVTIAPMLGLLGTVLGMFYAFYDVHRSVESMNALFDGLGVAVGTTVAGLIVAILAMILHSTLKIKLLKTLNIIEQDALSLSLLLARGKNDF
jgi:biopolymer transport protein ExbB